MRTEHTPAESVIISGFPSDWATSTIGESCEIRNNLRKPLSQTERETMEGEYPYYGPTGILDHINEYRVEGLHVLFPEDGDHFLKFSSMPMTMLVDGKFNVNNHAHIVRGTISCATEWVYYYFSNANFQRSITRQGVGRYKLNKASLVTLSLPIPPRQEQNEIIDILSTWDRAIELTEMLIEAKLRRKRGLMQHILTGRRRFPEFVQSLAVQQTKFGSLPKDWGYIQIGDIADQVNARTGIGKNLPVLSCTKYDGLVDSLQYFGKRIYSDDTSGYKLVRRGQFAYATNHIEEGSIGLLTDIVAGLVSPMYTVFKITGDIVPEFLFAVFKTELYRHVFEVSTNASVNRRGSLRWKQFAQIRVPVPSLSEQKRIVKLLRLQTDEIQQWESCLTALQQQKRGLMQQLLTGRKRINFGRQSNEC